MQKKKQLCPLCEQLLPQGIVERDLRKKLKDIETDAFENGKFAGVAQKDREHVLEMVAARKTNALLQRQLEQKSNEQRREEGERELFDVLEEARKNLWSRDTLRRTDHGEKGGDVIYTVMDDGEEAGVIVFENKNTGKWSGKFIEQAKEHRRQYRTPFVVIVTDVNPSAPSRAACATEHIPLVRQNEVVSLVSIMRASILTIAKLQLATADLEPVTRELLAYFTDDSRFRREFDGITTGVDRLRNRLTKVQEQHQKDWKEESTLHLQIEEHQRTIVVDLHSILKGALRKSLLPAAAAD